jgi:hypothetical protein
MGIGHAHGFKDVRALAAHATSGACPGRYMVRAIPRLGALESSDAATILC